MSMTHKRILNYVFNLSFFMLLLTGFAQMPIFKRYYIADVPGFGWLAEYYVTHAIHYIFAVVFILWVFYAGTLYLARTRGAVKHKVTAGIRSALLMGIIATGSLLVVKNFPGYRFPNGFIILLDVTHLVFALVYLVFAATLSLLKRKEP